MNFPPGGILLFYILLNLPFVSSQKKKRQFKMFETTVEIFSLVFLGFFFFRFLFQCLVQVSSRKPNSNRSNHKMS